MSESTIKIVPRPSARPLPRHGQRPTNEPTSTLITALLDKGLTKAVLMVEGNPTQAKLMTNRLWQYFNRYYRDQYQLHARTTPEGTIYWLTQRAEEPK